MKRTVLLFSLTSSFLYVAALFVHPLFADSCTLSSCPPTFILLEGFIPLITQTLLAVSIIVFFFMLVLNGFTFMVTRGDAEKIKQTRKSLAFSLLGFALIIGSATLLATINGILGTKSGAVADKTGSIHLSITSTYTATPLPENLVSHYKPTPYLTPPPAVPPGKGGPSTFVDNPISGCDLYGKTSECVGSVMIHSSEQDSIAAATTTVVNAYELSEDVHNGNKNIRFSLAQGKSFDRTSNGSLQGVGAEMEGIANGLAGKSPYTLTSTQGGNFNPLRRFHAFAIPENEAINFVRAGTPVIVGIPAPDGNYDFDVLISSNGSSVSVDDTTHVFSSSNNQQTMTVSQLLAKWNGVSFILEPSSDPNDAIYTIFGSFSQFSQIVAACIALHESNFDPNALGLNTGNPDPRYYRDEGIMQVNEIHWGENIENYGGSFDAMINGDPNKASHIATAHKYGGILTESDLFDPDFNVEAGYMIYRASGFGQWSTEKFCW